MSGRRMGRRVPVLGLVSGLAALAAASCALAGERAEAVDRTTLRVCADPASPPLSSQRDGGVEMQIAELFGRKLGVPVAYTWFPSGIGFYRRTLNVRRCDIVMSAAVGLDIAATTRPYYRSGYVIITRTGDRIEAPNLDSPALKDLTFGVQALSPGAALMAQAGLLDKAKVYALQGDADSTPVARRMLDDLAAHRIDAAILWGPIGGAFAAQTPGAFRVTLLSGVGASRAPVFDIAMAVRFGEPRWRAQVDQLIRDNQGEIDAILTRAHVPLLPLPEDKP